MKKTLIAITVIALFSCTKESTKPSTEKPMYIKIQAVTNDGGVMESKIVLVK